MRVCLYCKATFQPRTAGQGFCSTECNQAKRAESDSAKNRNAAMQRDNSACQDCGADDALECHHIKPLAQGGDHSLDNLQMLCHEHHRARHTKD